MNHRNHPSGQRLPWAVFSLAFAVFFLAGVQPSLGQATDPVAGYEWRMVASDMFSAPDEVQPSSRGRFEKTFHASETELSGTFRYFAGDQLELDDAWRGRFPRAPQVISVSQPLEMRIEGTLERRKTNAWHFYVNGLVEGRIAGQIRAMASASIDMPFPEPPIDTLEFTPTAQTPERFRVWMFTGNQRTKNAKAWVWWDYQRGGSPLPPAGNDPFPPTDPVDPEPDVTPPQPPPPGGRIIKADQYVVDQGELIWVPIHLIRPAGVANMNYEVSYDASVVQVEGDLNAGNLIRGRGIFSGNPRRSGLIRLGFAADVGYQRTGTVAEIPFRAIGRPGTRTALDIEVSMVQDAAGNTLPIDRIDGWIEIREGGSGVEGECDNHVGITVADAQCALDMSVGLRTVNRSVDIDSDGQVTSADARQILQIAIQGGRR